MNHILNKMTWWFRPYYTFSMLYSMEVQVVYDPKAPLGENEILKVRVKKKIGGGPWICEVDELEV